MSVWQLPKLVDTIMQMKNRDRTGIHNMMTYVVIPYVNSMGYDVYNLDTSDISLDTGRVTVRLDNTLSLVVSLTSDEPYVEEERIFVYIDELNPEITLYFKVLGVWAKVISVSLKDKTQAEAYTEILKYVKRDRLMQEYKQKGERFLTEGVVDRQLDAGNWDNEFLLNVLVDELKNPSDGLVEVLANRLGERYTTRDPKLIKEKLDVMKDVGLQDIVTRVVDSGKMYTEDVTYQGYTSEKDEVKVDNKKEPYATETVYSEIVDHENEDRLDIEGDDLTTLLKEIPT